MVNVVEIVFNKWHEYSVEYFVILPVFITTLFLFDILSVCILAKSILSLMWQYVWQFYNMEF